MVRTSWCAQMQGPGQFREPLLGCSDLRISSVRLIGFEVGSPVARRNVQR